MGSRTGDGRTAVERVSDREIVVTRSFDAPRRLVYQAWSSAELFGLWWPPKSNPFPLLACSIDMRTGGGYSLTFGKDADQSMTFFGTYLEVVPEARIVWTNEETEQGSVTTVTLEDDGEDRTLLTLTETYPSKEALDENFVGMEDALPVQFGQLDDLLATMAAKG